MARDQGYNVGLQATGVGLTVGALLYTAHAKGMEGVERARQDRVASGSFEFPAM